VFNPPPPPQAAASAAGGGVPRGLSVYYSAYGHVAALAAVLREAALAAGAAVSVRYFAETLSAADAARLHVDPVNATIEACAPLDLAAADAVLFGFPARFGAAPAQVGALLEQTAGMWHAGALVGKPCGVFVSSATQHGGQEAAVVAFQRSALHHGMLLVGLGAPALGAASRDVDVCGCSPYGLSTVAGGGGERQPTETEVAVAKLFARRITAIARKLL
jgi:NAD(P)H dehydrogenase (quinone)